MSPAEEARAPLAAAVAYLLRGAAKRVHAACDVRAARGEQQVIGDADARERWPDRRGSEGVRRNSDGRYQQARDALGQQDVQVGPDAQLTT